MIALIKDMAEQYDREAYPRLCIFCEKPISPPFLWLVSGPSNVGLHLSCKRKFMAALLKLEK